MHGRSLWDTGNKSYNRYGSNDGIAFEMIIQLLQICQCSPRDHWILSSRWRTRWMFGSLSKFDTMVCIIHPTLYIYIWIHIYIYIFTCTYLHIYRDIYTYIHVYTYIHIYMYTYIHIYIYTYIYIHIHIYIYTYTQICILTYFKFT